MALSSEWAAQVGHHATVASPGRPVRKEPVAIVRAAPRAHRYLAHAETPGLLDEDRPQIELLRTGVGASLEAREHLGPDLITRPANTNAAMHYDIGRPGERLPFDDVQTACQSTRVPWT